MASEGQTMHLTLQAALPLEKNPENVARSELWDRPRLTAHKAKLLIDTLETVGQAAASCLRRFKPHQDALWWQPADKDGKPLLDKEGNPVKRISGQLQVVIKLRKIAPCNGFALSAATRDGLYYKVADLLRSYAQRMLDPELKEKTSYPVIAEGFPLVFQLGFRFFENPGTGKIFLYLPLFPRGGHEENLRNNFNSSWGPVLREFGTDKSSTLIRTKGGLLLPLEFDKRGEATFMRDVHNLPRWRATDRPYDQRWLLELRREKEFTPKRVELFMRKGRVFVNIACEVACKPAVETENFMGVALGLQHLLDIVIINEAGNIIYQRKVLATEYDSTVFKELTRFWEKRRGKFHQRLETFHHQQMAEIVEEALRFKAVVAVERIGNIPKGKYSPHMNRRLSFWPFGKLAEIISYKSVLQGLPEPYEVYSATVQTLCSSCGASNKNGQQQIALEGPMYYCGSCNTKGDSGFNAALNLARRARELSLKGVVAR